LEKAATAATVVLMGPTQPATVLEVAVVVDQRTVAMAQMVIYELHIGVQTNGNFRILS
jgi:1,4-alpha-glucan branching enzyme